ncbi:CAP domain-containing protein, partial [Frankia canadensis]|uniref:CAP domain-containing protein n=1 Tax=Frankia canadensis TaxID=1836972 RepID=UPI0010555AF0
TVAAPPATVPAPPATGQSAFATAVVAATNQQRRAAGCGDLTVDAVLTSVAQAHSADMATANYFSHNSQDGRTPFDRITAAGFSFSVAAENIAAGQRDPAAVMQAWMNSPGHRANILNCALTRIGVGVANGGTYGVYWTQDFGTPRR